MGRQQNAKPALIIIPFNSKQLHSSCNPIQTDKKVWEYNSPSKLSQI